MTSKFEGFEQNPSAKTPQHQEDLTAERFELLSAYIDGELTSTQSNQVKVWIDADPETKQLYVRLLNLQGQMQHSAAPASEKPIEEITAGVFCSIDRRHRQRRLVWGAGAIAASAMAIITGIVPGIFAPTLRTADTETTPIARPVMLAVAVNKPAIDIPKAPTGSTVEPKFIDN